MSAALEYIGSEFGKFHNGLRVLLNIDAVEFPGPAEDWPEFRDNPWRYFIRAEDEVARALWKIIQRRNERALARVIGYPP
jgi:hypothetical protein